MTAEDRIKEILYGYEMAGLIECDPVEVLSYLSDDVIGIGMGEQGFVSSKKEISDIMMATIRKDDTAAYTLEIKDVVIHRTTEDTASLCSKVYVTRHCKEEQTLSGFMQSLSFVMRENDWWICGLHASPIMLSEEAIESYPLKFADSTLAKLKSELQQDTFELMNKNFSGGIIGVYAKESFPLYFVNDMMIGMLGYEREEFEHKFANGIGSLFDLDPEKRGELASRSSTGEDFFWRAKWEKKDGSELWVESCTRRSDDGRGENVLISIVTDITEIVTLQMETEQQNKTILSSVSYGSKIQRNLLPAVATFERIFDDYAVLWSPKDMVGGDIYWLRQFEKGSVLAVSDCTGHGIPGAFLTMLVVSILDNVVTEENCQDTASLLYLLDQNMAGVLTGKKETADDKRFRITDIRDGCDAAVFYIDHGGDVRISASNMYTFLCNGEAVKRIRGQKFYIGEGKLEQEKVHSEFVPFNAQNRFYVSSDGLFDQIGGEMKQPYGYRPVKDIILNSCHHSQQAVLENLWEAFESYRGENIRRDDVQVISFSTKQKKTGR